LLDPLSGVPAFAKAWLHGKRDELQTLEKRFQLR